MNKKVILLFLIFLSLPFLQARAEESHLSDGHYTIGVSLLHAYEDRLSMGNAGLAEKGELIKEGDKLKLYLKMQTLTVSNLTTSVKRFYLLDKDKKAYVSGTPYQYNISLYDGKVKNPSIFAFQLLEKQDTYPVLVDPGVSAMGSDPIKARLHLDWQTLEPLTDESSSLEALALQEETCEGTHKTQAVYDDLTVRGLSGGEFTLQSLTRKKLEEEGLPMSPLSQVKGYYLGYWAPLVEIPEDKTTNVNALAKPFAIKEPITLAFRKDQYTEVWQKVAGKFQKLESVVGDNTLEVKVTSLGVFALTQATPSAHANGLKGNASPIAGLSPQGDTLKSLPKKPAKIVSQPRVRTHKVVSTSSIKAKNATLPKVKKVTREAVQAESAKVSQDNDQTPENTSLATKEPRERYGIIALVVAIYATCFLFGLWLWKKVWVRLKEEVERAYYIRLLEIKGEEK